ncbi:MAG: hypothetical protein LUC45_05460 [Paraprevotella sp.]|nr:hypothetical protein [Paraprevotella sp.]
MALGKKTGGRLKETPNKSTLLGKDAIVSLLSDYSHSGLMASDFSTLEPKDRLLISEKLMQYVLPKMQSTSIDIAREEKNRTIEDTLMQLSGEEE